MVEQSPEQRHSEEGNGVQHTPEYNPLVQPIVDDKKDDTDTIDGVFVEEPTRTEEKQKGNIRPIEIINKNRSLTLMAPGGEQIEVSTADFIRDVVQSYNEESSGIDSSFESSAAKLQEQMSKADFKQLVGGVSSDLAIRTVLARRYPGFSKLSMEEQDAMVMSSADHLGKLQLKYQGHMAQVAATNADEAMYHTMAEMFSGGYLGRLKGWLTVDSEIRSKMYQKVGDAMDLLLAAKFGKLNHEEVQQGLILFQQLHAAKAEAGEAQARAEIVTKNQKEEYLYIKASNALQIRRGYIESTTEQICELKDIAADGIDQIVTIVTKRPAEAVVYLFKETTGHTFNMLEKTADKGAELLRRGTNHVKDWFTDEKSGLVARVFAMPRVLLQKISDPPVIAGASVGVTFGGLGGYAIGGMILKGTEMLGFLPYVGSYASYLIYVPTVGLGIGGGVYGAWLIQNRILSKQKNTKTSQETQNHAPQVLQRPTFPDSEESSAPRISLDAFRRRNR